MIFGIFEFVYMDITSFQDMCKTYSTHGNYKMHRVFWSENLNEKTTWEIWAKKGE